MSRNAWRKGARLRHFCLVGLWATLACTGIAFGGSDGPRFAIFRVDLVEREGAPALEREVSDARLRNVFISQEYVLATALRVEPPVLTEVDIVEYCWATKRIQLTAEGAQRWDAEGGYDTALTGVPLQIVVDGEPQYAALLWNPWSSLSSKLPQFFSKTLDNCLLIRSRDWRVSAEGDTILGASLDPQVKQVFDELGKLTEDCRVN